MRAPAQTRPRVDEFLPIEDYAAIGDGGALALVGLDGAIDWMCLPQLDSPSVFGRLLDPRGGGDYIVQPAVPFESARRYLERTNVLETTFQTADGEVRLTDALTMSTSEPGAWRELVRKVECVGGTVPMRWSFTPRPGYGATSAQIERAHDAIVARAGGLQLAQRTWDAGQGEVSRGRVTGSFELTAGDKALLVTVATDGPALPLSGRDGAERRLRQTGESWRAWVQHHTYDGEWQEAVERSLLAIKLLADIRTGAIAAAGTTSLPEALGGERNYDYRYGWVRDLCFTLDALIGVGMDEQTQASLTWLLNATARSHPRIDPVYALAGDVIRAQQSLPLPGYRFTAPVLVGNNAGAQLQLGGFGDLIETVCLYVSAGHVLAPTAAARLADVGNLLTHIWENEDSGLWELGGRAHYGTSKLGVWVAFQRLIELADRGEIPARYVARWRRARGEVERFIEARLFSPTKNSYLFKAGSEELDCGMLLAARRGFGDPQGERMNGTIDAIARELHAQGPLYYRYSGMQDEENAFLACSFWMIEALALAGRVAEAAELMDAMVALGNDVGLYSEEMEPGTRAMRGNMPQALSHLSLIQAASAIERARTGSSQPSCTTQQPSRLAAGASKSD